MEVNHKEFIESQVAMTKTIMSELLELGENEPVFVIKANIDDIGDNLIVNYYYANKPKIDYVFPDEYELELIQEYKDSMKKLDAFRQQNPDSVVAMTLLELLDAVREQLESYRIKLIY